MSVALLATTIALAACSETPSSNKAYVPTPAPPQSRPLALPSVAPGASCPISAMQNFPNPPGNKLPGYGYGPGPVFLSGQLNWFTNVYALIMVPPSVDGSVLVRGHQLDGPGGLPLEGQTGNGNLSINGPSGTWRSWGGQMIGGPGCYALQVDGKNFTEQIIFSISPGPAPPA